MNWQPIETAPKDKIILLGTESDPFVDKHMFFVDIGWWYGKFSKCEFWSVTDDDVCNPSHWAPIESPVSGAPVTVYKDCRYQINE